MTMVVEVRTIEDYEIWGDLLDEIREWEDYEEDMATNPYEDNEPTEAEIERMARIYEGK